MYCLICHCQSIDWLWKLRNDLRDCVGHYTSLQLQLQCLRSSKYGTRRT